MTIEKFVESNDILTDAWALVRRLQRDGYLFFRGLFPRAEVLQLRRSILEICHEAGWLKKVSSLMDGVTDHAPVLEGEPVWEPVYEKVQKLESFHRLKLHPNVQTLMERIFDEPVVCLPMTIARIAFPMDNERATQPHQDWLYVQGSSETISCWAPLGDVPEEVGGLMVLRGSHKSGFLIPRRAPGPGGNTVAVDPTLPWAATDYRAGDVLLFKSLTIHGARPNQTPDRLRLSIDFRYTGISHSISEGWLKPHFNWRGPQFSWDNLDKDWKDASLRRYWERIPNLKTCPHEHRVYAKD
ncbi:MAG: phytanoyl-CoA dioxygenase family protein [Planctomycetes bacterium]|nr:phytanoyl-CoA dioxygenase family protein [Planctomycetota bacterium]